MADLHCHRHKKCVQGWSQAPCKRLSIAVAKGERVLPVLCLQCPAPPFCLSGPQGAGSQGPPAPMASRSTTPRSATQRPRPTCPEERRCMGRALWYPASAQHRPFEKERARLPPRRRVSNSRPNKNTLATAGRGRDPCHTVSWGTLAS